MTKMWADELAKQIDRELVTKFLGTGYKYVPPTKWQKFKISVRYWNKEIKYRIWKSVQILLHGEEE